MKGLFLRKVLGHGTNLIKSSSINFRIIVRGVTIMHSSWYFLLKPSSVSLCKFFLVRLACSSIHSPRPNVVALWLRSLGGCRLTGPSDLRVLASLWPNLHRLHNSILALYIYHKAFPRNFIWARRRSAMSMLGAKIWLSRRKVGKLIFPIMKPPRILRLYGNPPVFRCCQK